MHELTKQQDRIYSAIRVLSSTTYPELCELIAMNHNTIKSCLRRLEAFGVISKTKDRAFHQPGRPKWRYELADTEEIKAEAVEPADRVLPDPFQRRAV